MKGYTKIEPIKLPDNMSLRGIGKIEASTLDDMVIHVQNNIKENEKYIDDALRSIFEKSGYTMDVLKELSSQNRLERTIQIDGDKTVTKYCIDENVIAEVILENSLHGRTYRINAMCV